MPVTDSQLQLIFRYFDGDLSADEEQELMQQLQQNKDIQAAFDQQVLMSRFAQADAAATPSSMAFEPADDFLQRVTGNVQEKNETQPAVVPIEKRDYRWLAAAAAVLIFLLAGILYYQSHKQPTGNRMVKTAEKDTATLTQKPIPALPDSNRLIAANDLYEKLYEAYYEPLPKNTLQIPAAAQPYQAMYDRRNYEKLVAENESSLGVKGQSSAVEENTVLTYFRFYKALAALQIGKIAEAEKELQKVTTSSITNPQLINQANWYLLMVYLKKEDKESSVLMTKTIGRSKQNPYYQRAADIEKALSQ